MSEIEPGSIALFFLLLSAFIAVLALRAHLRPPADSVATALTSPTPPPAVVAKSLSLSTNF